MPLSRSHRLLAALAAVALLVSACGDGGEGDPAATPTDGGTGSQLQATVASFDMATGEDQRLLLGLIDGQNGVLGGGQVQVRVGYLGTGQESEAPTEIAMSEPVTAEFLPVPGTGADPGDTPEILEDGAGVYEAHVDFDRAGFWGVQVGAEVDGAPVTATARFQVAEQHAVPAVGDPAPAVDNPTLDSGGVAPGVLDSRAAVGDDGEVPDPSLHDAAVADVLEAGRPMVVVISTPVYCRSQFCGPITNTVEDLGEQYGDRAEFIHLEVWQDYENQELNPWVEEWIFDPETGGNEPWVFLVGADGTITARWGNVLDGAELESMLQELPAS